jgi:hypothetical protein
MWIAKHQYKVKLSMHLISKALLVSHEDVSGSRCIEPHFLDLGTSYRWVVGFMTGLPYPQGKSPQYPLDRRLGGPYCWSQWYRKVKILDNTGTQTPTPPSSSL